MVTVDLHMYAAVDVRVTLAGRQPNAVDWTGTVLRHVFRGVPAGIHQIVVNDVMGFSETFDVVVSQPPLVTSIPRTPLDYRITVEPSEPMVGDLVTVTALVTMPTGVGNLPRYQLLGDFEPVLRLESPNEVGFDRFGEVANWRLMALETGRC